MTSILTGTLIGTLFLWHKYLHHSPKSRRSWIFQNRFVDFLGIVKQHVSCEIICLVIINKQAIFFCLNVISIQEKKQLYFPHVKLSFLKNLSWYIRLVLINWLRFIASQEAQLGNNSEYPLVDVIFGWPLFLVTYV